MTRVALISGGQRGIGLGIAHQLAGAGYHLALASEMPADAGEVVSALGQLGTYSSKIRYYQHDLREVDATGRLLQQVETDLGPVTTLVSNAGVPAKVRGDMLEMTDEAFDQVMDINLKGAFFLAQGVARRMLELSEVPYRSIIFVTSVSAGMVSSERAEYCISKAAASMMMKLYASRLAANAIGVFEIRPGIIDTAMTAGVKDKYSVRIEQGLVPAGRWGMPSDIASVVLPLVEGQFAFATGSVIPVDGGLSIHRL
jgi:NAD(P)-dependent dehydrogenase (short-subunit alcohol dehydrogenase family)